MNSETKPESRKTGRLIAKNLIILLVLVAVCVLSIFAWFTKGNTAIADGINVRSRADGVQVSWDGENFYDNLQELDESNVVAGKSGLAKNISGVDGEPLSLSLITGNGTSFFEPYLNRRLGTILYNTDGSWQGIQVDSSNSQGRYVDIDLYFRGTTERDIYLAGDSLVSPKDADSNFSEYGAFSKDYIAAASRIAFLNSDKSECSFIWAPNADVELKENEAGYIRYTTTATEEITISGGGTTKVDGGVEDDGNTYYFWTFWDDSVVTSYPNDLSQFEARQFTYDSELRYFVTEVTTYIPTYGGDNTSIPIFINESSSATSANINSYNTYIDGASSKNLIKDTNGQFFGVTNSNFNVGNSVCSNAMYIINGQIAAGSKITYKLGYDPYNKLLVVLGYQVEGGGSFELGGQETDIITTVTYYPLENNTTCLLVNPTSSTAISTGENRVRDVNFKDSTKISVTPLSGTLSEQFTAVKTGDGYEATYKFRNNKTNQYLTVSNGNVSFTASGSAFSLYYNSEFEGPLLRSGDYYVVIQNGNLTAVQLGYLDFDDAVTIYIGSSYELITNNTSDSQSYQYYNFNTNSVVTLSSASTPMLFTSTSSTPATTKIGNTKIATLTKANDEDEYFEAHIVMRIWVEGTDREALVPLADGIFDMSLHFISQ